MEPSNILIDFLAFLDEQNTSYVILGDTRYLPDQIDGDVDFCININPQYLSSLISKFCHQNHLF